MDTKTGNSSSDPFLAHLTLMLSIYELRSPAHVPRYDGPSTDQTDTILRAVRAMARRMYNAEEALTSIKAPEIWKNGLNTKKRRRVGDNLQMSISSSKPSHKVLPSSGTVIPHGRYPPLPYGLASFAVGSKKDVRMSENGSGHPAVQPSHSNSSLNTRADCPTPPPPPTSLGDLASCSVCGYAVTKSITNATMSSSKSMDSLSLQRNSISPQVVPFGGPLSTAALASGMSAVEELRLLRAQVQDVARVCNAVACGDLSQRITVPVQGVVMVQLKNVVNRMVDKLDRFAKDVTRVSLEVGTEGKHGGQALGNGVKGVWLEVTHNINRMCSNLTDQVRSIADVTTADAHEDLMRKIEIQGEEEMATLKMTANSMGDQFNKSSSEDTRVALEVATQGILGKHVGGAVQGSWVDLILDVIKDGEKSDGSGAASEAVAPET